MSSGYLHCRHLRSASIPPQMSNTDSEIIIQRHGDGIVFESVNVKSGHSKLEEKLLKPLLQTHHIISLYGGRALCPSADYPSFDREHRFARCHC